VRLANFTFVHRQTGAATGSNAVLLRGGTDYSLINGVITTPRFCLDFDDAATTQAANPALDEAGAPVIQSVVMQCTAGAFRTDGNEAAVQAAFTAGTNNNSGFTASLANVFVNGANETAVTAFNAATIDAFFTTTTYIGAVRDANDTWYRGWTCDSATANFGTNSACTALPAA